MFKSVFSLAAIKSACLGLNHFLIVSPENICEVRTQGCPSIWELVSAFYDNPQKVKKKSTGDLHQTFAASFRSVPLKAHLWTPTGFFGMKMLVNAKKPRGLLLKRHPLLNVYLLMSIKCSSNVKWQLSNLLDCQPIGFKFNWWWWGYNLLFSRALTSLRIVGKNPNG